MADIDVRHRHTAVQRAAAATGAVFLVVGVMGFIPGITTNYGALSWAGHDSGALLLGLFQVSVLHNAVHLLFGIAGLAFARSVTSARAFLIAGGALYALLWLYGLVIDQSSADNVVPVNSADNWLHFVLAVGMITMGLALSRHEGRTGIGPSIQRQTR